MRSIDEIMSLAPVIPVMVIERIEDAVPMAKALVAGGLRVLEITLRTECALIAIANIVRECPEAVVGAGTVLSPADVEAAKAAGAAFLVSPGATVTLARSAQAAAMPLLPGVSSASEVMTMMECGYDRMKFFPAEAAGGTAMLKSLAGPFPSIRFCPTGGVKPENASNYLALANVACVGGSWMIDSKAVKKGEWGEIEALAREAVSSLSAI